MRGDPQYQLKEVQDWAAHLQQLQSILLEFDDDCGPIEGQLGCTFYNGLRPSIRLWIEEVGRERLSWEELVTTANKAEAKACIHHNQHLDQQFSRGKRPLKLTFKESQDHPEKTQSKATTSGLSVTPPGKPSSSSGPQRSEHGLEASEKARKKKKKKANRERRGKRRREGSTPATGSNAKNTANKKNRDLSQVTCYTGNKKGHYSKDCTEPPKNERQSRRPPRRWLRAQKLNNVCPAFGTRSSSTPNRFRP